jgi:hypothetical protein
MATVLDIYVASYYFVNFTLVVSISRQTAGSYPKTSYTVLRDTYGVTCYITNAMCFFITDDNFLSATDGTKVEVYNDRSLPFFD